MKAGYKKYDSIEDKYKYHIEHNNLTQDSKDILRAWMKERRSNGFRDRNNIALMGTIRTIIEQVGNDINGVSKEKLQDFFADSTLKPTTKLWYQKALKRFYKWLSIYRDEVQYLQLINWINTKELSKKCNRKAAKRREDNCPTPEETKKMINQAMHLRDKLAIALIADTGCRAETVGASHNQRSINVGQVEFHKGYALIKGITEKFDKERDVVVTEALSYLIKYWNELPEDHKAKPENPLFISYAHNRKGKRWGYTGLKDMMHRVSKESIGRIINPHDFRHFKSTRLALDENISDDAKMKLMGWSSRRMLDRYSHVKFDDAKVEFLEKKGIISVDKDKKRVEAAILKPKECFACHNICSEGDTVCEKCSTPLDYNKIIEKSDAKEKEIETLQGQMVNLQKQLSRMNEAIGFMLEKGSGEKILKDLAET